ncbi:MAG: 23S rRNA (guanosine(2251)-2'-O)-methyltransferase RlmB [Gammaproteobacteria bacterium]|nr:23S rRNA (guanosine(2251)-2'-O)-methyltransferase RlmB [Gammaproteobacteria bacterium]
MSEVSGIHAVEALLRKAPERVRLLLLQRNRRDARIETLLDLAAEHNVRHEFAARQRLDRLGGPAHQGAVALCHELRLTTEAEFKDQFDGWPSPKLFLVLDGIDDPRNLGACVRTAVAAGVHAILWPRRRSAPLSAAALKAAAGSAEQATLVEVANLARRLEWLKRLGVWLIGADGTASHPWTAADLTRNVAIVVGGEGRGLRQLTRKTCDELAAIPMAGDVGSLNVAVATGVMLFEAVRQRTLAG